MGFRPEHLLKWALVDQSPTTEIQEHGSVHEKEIAELSHEQSSSSRQFGTDLVQFSGASGRTQLFS